MNLATVILDRGSPKFCKKPRALSIPDVFKILDCSTHVMIGIYWIEQEQFWYCNEAFHKGIGRGSGASMDMGWQRLYDGLDKEKLSEIKHKINSFISIPFKQNTMLLNYRFTDYDGKIQCIQHKMVLHEIKGNAMVINYFQDISESNEKANKVASISDREKQVLSLIADGYSSKEIADKLCISNHTAISHRKNLIEKFNVKNTAQLIKEAFQLI